MIENKWVTQVLKPRLKHMFPGCIIMKNDPNDNQGIPDITVIWGGTVAMLEAKKKATAKRQPNQEWYIDHCKVDLSIFAEVVYPENLDEVMDDLYDYFYH